jgi:hypothetical protein
VWIKNNIPLCDSSTFALWRSVIPLPHKPCVDRLKIRNFANLIPFKVNERIINLKIKLLIKIADFFDKNANDKKSQKY